MRPGTSLPALLCLLLAGAPAFCQDWNALTEARGWTRLEKDGSGTFHDASARKLRTWMKDGGVVSEVDTKALPGVPEKWTLDMNGNAWVVTGTTLTLLTREGVVASTLKLPGEVEDLSWDIKGFVLSYRGTVPFVEKREFRTGRVLWTHRGVPPKNDRSPVPYRIVVSEEGDVIVASNGTLDVGLVDGLKGDALGQTPFTYKDHPAPPLFNGPARGNLRWWLGKSCFLGALPGARVPSAGLMGLVLARMDPSQGTVDFLPTGLTEDHFFAGINLEGEAIFVKPAGGLAFVPLP